MKSGITGRAMYEQIFLHYMMYETITNPMVAIRKFGEPGIIVYGGEYCC